jgi:hypothetical protein
LPGQPTISAKGAALACKPMLSRLNLFLGNGQTAVAFGLKFNVIEMRGTQSRDRLSGTPPKHQRKYSLDKNYFCCTSNLIPGFEVILTSPLFKGKAVAVKPSHL